MGLLLLLAAWLGAARAAVPVTLPPGEPAAAWTEAARLAGVQLGAGTGAPSANIAVQGTQWRVQVLARDGTRHTLVVPAPRDAAGREDLLATIVSLAEPMRTTLPAVALPPVPTPKPVVKPAPAKPRPPAVKAASVAAPSDAPPESVDAARAEPVPDSDTSTLAADTSEVDTSTPAVDTSAPDPSADPVGPAETPVAPTGVRETPAAPLVDLDTPEPPARVPLHARLSTGAVVRVDASVVPSLAVTGGVGIGPVRAGLSVGGTLASTLAEGRTMRAADLALVVEAGDRGPWGAVRAGVAIREWSEEGEPVGTTFTPTARLDAGWGFRLGDTRFRPAIWGAADLAPTTLYVAGVEEGRFTQAFFGVDLGFEIVRSGK